jgi:hypothetical protein
MATGKVSPSLAVLALLVLAGTTYSAKAQSATSSRIERGVSSQASELHGRNRILEELRTLRLSLHNSQSQTEAAVKPATAHVKAYNFQTVDFPGASFSEVFDYSDATAVGSVEITSGTPLNAFTFHGSAYRVLNVPQAATADPFGINASGTIVGLYFDSSNTGHGFIDDAGVFTTYDFSGASYTELDAISDSGILVGSTLVAGVDHGFTDDHGTITTIDYPGASATSAFSVNSNGDVVGAYTLNGARHSFLWQNSQFSTIDFPLAVSSSPFSINDAGDIAGSYVDSIGEHGYIYSRGIFHIVDVPFAKATTIDRLNNKGIVAGSFVDDRGEFHGMTGR